ncbi:MAG: S49 family peptidase [Vicinamibacterales bacterium]
MATDRIAAFFRTRPLAIERTRLPELFERAETQAARMAGMTPQQIDRAVRAATDTPLGRVVGATAVIPITGVITQKSFDAWFFGGTSVERLLFAFRQYLNDPAVSAIVFDVDSPGGEAYGLQEGFEEIFAARDRKPVVSIINPYMASAAYFLGCAASTIWMTKSGQVGSIGCYTLHLDFSEMLRQAGVSPTLIFHGAHKVDGNQYEALSDDARDDLQASVSYYGEAFEAAVAKGRGVSVAEVRADFGQGRMFHAPEARRIGLVDRIGTRDELLASLARGRGQALAAAAGLAARVSAPPAPLDAHARQLQRDADEIAITLALTEI